MSNEMKGLLARASVGAVFLIIIYIILSFGTSLWYIVGATVVFVVGFMYIFEIVVLVMRLIMSVLGR